MTKQESKVENTITIATPIGFDPGNSSTVFIIVLNGRLITIRIPSGFLIYEPDEACVRKGDCVFVNGKWYGMGILCDPNYMTWTNNLKWSEGYINGLFKAAFKLAYLKNKDAFDELFNTPGHKFHVVTGLPKNYEANTVARDAYARELSFASAAQRGELADILGFDKSLPGLNFVKPDVGLEAANVHLLYRKKIQGSLALVYDGGRGTSDVAVVDVRRNIVLKHRSLPSKGVSKVHETNQSLIVTPEELEAELQAGNTVNLPESYLNFYAQNILTIRETLPQNQKCTLILSGGLANFFSQEQLINMFVKTAAFKQVIKGSEFDNAKAYICTISQKIRSLNAKANKVKSKQDSTSQEGKADDNGDYKSHTDLPDDPVDQAVLVGKMDGSISDKEVV